MAQEEVESRDVSVKIDAEVYRALRMLAAYEGTSISDYLSEIVFEAIRPRWEAMVQQMNGALSPAENESSEAKPKGEGEVSKKLRKKFRLF